jgi:hypothetical protein
MSQAVARRLLISRRKVVNLVSKELQSHFIDEMLPFCSHVLCYCSPLLVISSCWILRPAPLHQQGYNGHEIRAYQNWETG